MTVSKRSHIIIFIMYFFGISAYHAFRRPTFFISHYYTTLNNDDHTHNEARDTSVSRASGKFLFCLIIFILLTNITSRLRVHHHLDASKLQPNQGQRQRQRTRRRRRRTQGSRRIRRVSSLWYVFFFIFLYLY